MSHSDKSILLLDLSIAFIFAKGETIESDFTPKEKCL
jgi:hypothetical protein